MSLYLTLFVMLFTGLTGGTINYILAKNTKSNDRRTNIWNSLLVGIGATILIPLFLELAQSKLLDHMRSSWQINEVLSPKKIAEGLKNDRTPLPINNSKQNIDQSPLENPPLKTYLVFAAYCFLAAAAGPRFINSLIDGVLKEKEIERLNEENKEIAEQKESVEKIVERQNQFNNILAGEEESNAFQDADNTIVIESTAKPKIGQITVPDDPQKGRFGGERERNGRKLFADVDRSPIPGLYRVKLWVESTDQNRPLDADVVYYLHNTFRPSVFTIKVAEFQDGKAEVEPKTAWGAFTVGVVTDNGDTLLEYDLATDSQFPSAFRLM